MNKLIWEKLIRRTVIYKKSFMLKRYPPRIRMISLCSTSVNKKTLFLTKHNFKIFP